jgi:hypothetical protein
VGSKAEVTALHDEVRFTSETGHRLELASTALVDNFFYGSPIFGLLGVRYGRHIGIGSGVSSFH